MGSRSFRLMAAVSIVVVTCLVGLDATAAGAAAIKPLGPPSKVTTSLAGYGAVRVAWSAPSSTGGLPVTYRVTSSPDASSPNGRTCIPTGTTFCTVSGLRNGTAYTFTVTARNGRDPDTTAVSRATTPMTAPAPPTWVTAAGGNGSITIGWTAPGDTGGGAIKSYRAEAIGNPSIFCIAISTADSCTIKGLSVDTALSFSVTVTNTAMLTSTARLTPQARVLPPITQPIYSSTGARCTLVGTEGNDYLIGTSGDDVICGLGGDDLIDGGSGNDTVDGGSGNDSLKGGAGNDVVLGQDGIDIVSGGSGLDNEKGGAGDDVLRGDSGVDTINGGTGDNACDFSFGEVLTGTCVYDRAAVGGSTVSQTGAAIPSNFRIVSNLLIGPGADLTGANLAGADLRGLSLRWVNLTDADLTGADLTGADLTSATLKRANLSGADLTRASLRSVDGTSANFFGAKLDGTDLSGAIFFGVRSGAIVGNPVIGFGNFSLSNGYILTLFADLRNADLHDSTLTGLLGADLSGANLRGATLTGSYPSAQFVGADLSGANLADAYLDSADFTGADLTDAKTGRTMLIAGSPRSLPAGCRVRYSTLSCGQTIDLHGRDLRALGDALRSADLRGANLTDTDLSGLDLSGKDLTGADLEGANLSNTVLPRFPGLNLVHSGRVRGTPGACDCRLRNGYILGGWADLTGADLHGLDLSAPMEGSWFGLDVGSLRGANLTGARVDGLRISPQMATGIIGVPLNSSTARVIQGRLVTTGYPLLGQDLSGADLRDFVSRGSLVIHDNLRGVDLTGADLSRAVIGDVDLAGSRIDRLNLRGASLIGLDLSGVDLAGVDLSGADLTRCNLRGAHLGGAILADTSFSGSNLSGADLTGADLSTARLDGSRAAMLAGSWGLGGVKSGDLWGAPSGLPAGWRQTRGLLIGPGANLTGATLANLDLTGAVLTGADLTGADLTGIRLAGATLTGVISANVTGTPASLPSGWTLTGGRLIGPS